MNYSVKPRPAFTCKCTAHVSASVFGDVYSSVILISDHAVVTRRVLLILLMCLR